MGPCRAFPAPEKGPETAYGVVADEARGFLTGSERLARANRLGRASEIRRCLNDGRRHRAAHLEIIWTENTTGHPRMGLIVPRFQASAVARNRLRRRLKEIWRREIQSRQPAWDVLVRARAAAYQADFGLLRDELLAWRDSTCPAG
jgi:ribonuclease P protein component